MSNFEEGDLVHGYQNLRGGEFVVSVIGRILFIDDDGVVWIDASPPEGSRWGLKPSVYQINKVMEE